MAAKNFELVASLGAHMVIDHIQAGTSKLLERYDVIYDTVFIKSFLKKRIYLSRPYCL
jgi:NADPH:quinone reductase-like Zn-dependent oxidoreductase